MKNIYILIKIQLVLFLQLKKKMKNIKESFFLLASDEHTITPKKEIETISNGVEVF